MTNQNQAPEERICRCFAPPPGSGFEKGKLYRWGYIIDGMVAYHESGETWSDGEIMFASRFQILSGKVRFGKSSSL